MLSWRHNFLFIHVPKTGGNAIQQALVNFSEDRIEARSAEQDGEHRFAIRSALPGIHKHSTLADYQRQIDPERFARLAKISCVRNPWDRCISYFFSPHRGTVHWSPQDFERFVLETVQPHTHYLALEGGTGDPFGHVDVILRFERLAEDFAMLCTRLGLGPLALRRLNMSRRGDYRDYYTSDRLIEMVADKFAPEIERFGYAF